MICPNRSNAPVFLQWRKRRLIYTLASKGETTPPTQKITRGLVGPWQGDAMPDHDPLRIYQDLFD
jgi:hypothetical protein